MTRTNEVSKIPPQVAESGWESYMKSIGLFLDGQGKVRDRYGAGTKILFLASDRISIFNFPLNVLVPKKGEVLTALDHFWRTKVLKEFRHHLILDDRGFSNHLNWKLPNGRGFPLELAKRTMLVRNVLIPPIEFIYRAYLGGSVYEDYLANGVVAGSRLPPGIRKWGKLDVPIFTPSTKEESDRNITVQEYRDIMIANGLVPDRPLEMFRRAYNVVNKYSSEQGYVYLDTKCEGYNEIADEAFTSDSSRVTTIEEAEAAPREGRDPEFYDKEPVRRWGRTVATPIGLGLHKLKAENPDHRRFVHALAVPNELIVQTSEAIQTLFKGLVGKPLEQYQKEDMGIG